MADTFTTTLNLTKPEVGASADTWGTKLNDNLDDIDALFSSGPVLKVANGGTAATTASGARTSLGLGTIATQDASSVAITGGAVNVGTLGITANVPYLDLIESDAATDNKRWLVYAENETFYIYAENDAGTNGGAAVQITRTGTTVDSIALAATAVTINGNAVYHAGNLTPLTASSGSFTAYLRATNDGANLASGPAYWKKCNGVVTLQLPTLTLSTGITDPMLVDGLPADIVPASSAQYLLAPGYDMGTETALKVTVPAAGDFLIIQPYNAATFSGGASVKGIISTSLSYIL